MPPEYSPSLIADALAVIESLRLETCQLREAQREPIAVVGAACRFPGGVFDMDGYWHLLQGRRSAVAAASEARCRLARWQGSKPPVGGFLENIDEFDARFFGISAREATYLDPQHRIALEVAWEAIESSGRAPRDLKGSTTGVFLGITTSEYYHEMLRHSVELSDIYAATGNAHNAAVGRISHVLGLHGPSIAVDTACSSSLVAVHLGCQALRSGECDMALVGGVNLILSEQSFRCFAKWGMLSPDGRCKAFDAAADGFVRSEGCGFVGLKRLSAALRDGDPIRAIIRGSSVKHDGRSSALTVPCGPSQVSVITEALKNAGIPASRVEYIEAHGTGTHLGDPIETDALSEVLKRQNSPQKPLLIGSVKTNLGHTEAASGIAGLLKVILALERDAIPAHLHFTKWNPRIGDASCLRVVDEAVEWPRTDTPRVAGISSFGLSGTNAHVIVEEGPVRASVAPTGARCDLTISATSEKTLWELARRYVAFLSEHPDTNVGDLCYTARAGRQLFPHRLTVAGSSGAEIGSGLIDAMDRRLPTHEPESEVGAGRRIPLPATPFHRESYWALPSISHPLLETTVTDQTEKWLIARETFVSLVRFSYLQDHCIGHRPVFPASAYLEVAYAAAAEALASEQIELRSVEFGEALFVTTEQTILRITISRDYRFVIGSRKTDLEPWTPHCTGWVDTHSEFPRNRAESSLPESLIGRYGPGEDSKRSYELLAAMGNRFGPTFQSIHRIWLIDDVTAWSHVCASPTVESEISRYRTHPAVGDALGQSAMVLANRVRTGSAPFVGYSVERVRSFRRATAPLFSRTRLRSRPLASDEELITDVDVYDADGSVVSELTGARLRRLNRSAVSTDTVEDTYRIAWRDVPREDALSIRSTRWLVFADRRGTGDWAEQLLISLGESCTVVRRENFDDSLATIRRCCSGAGGEYTVLYFWGLDPGVEVSDAYDDLVMQLGSCLPFLCGAMRSGDPRSPVRLWIATRGAQAVTGHEAEVNSPQASLWGFARSLALELRNNWGGIVDFDPDASADDSVRRFLGETSAPSREDQIAYRGSRRLVPRLSGPLPATPGKAKLDPKASYLIVGGFGGLGSATVKCLVEAGARHLIVLSRTVLPAQEEWDRLDPADPAEERIRTIYELRHQGVGVHVISADVSDEREVRTALNSYPDMASHPIRGVVHAAGTLSYGPAAQLTQQDVAAVLKAKLLGSWVLHRVFEKTPLDFFVLFSSASGVIKSPLLSLYAAANAFQDGLAHFRQSRGLPALSIDWGTWSGLGMASAISPDLLHSFTDRVAGMIAPLGAIKTLSILLGTGEAQMVVPGFDATFLSGRRPDQCDSFFAEIAGAPARISSGADNAAPGNSIDPAHSVQSIVAAIAGFAPSSIDPNTTLTELGVDSLMAFEIKQRIEGELNKSISIARLIEGPTIRELTEIIGITASIDRDPEDTTSPVRREFPLAYSQKALWVLSKLEPAAASYNVCAGARLRPAPDELCVQAAIELLFERHRLLRSAVESGPNGPTFRFNAVAMKLETHNAENLDDASVRRRLIEDHRRPFHLASGPLVRIALYRRNDDDAFLLLSAHHIVADAWSMGLLVEDLCECYKAARQGEAPLPHKMGAEYGDFVTEEERYVASSRGAKASRFWKNMLNGVDRGTIATSKRDAAFDSRHLAVPFALSPNLTMALKEFAAIRQTTTFCVLLTAYYAALRHATTLNANPSAAEEFLTVGIPVTLRADRRFARTVGNFINMIALPVKMTDAMSFCDLLDRAGSTLLAAMEHKEYPFSLVVNEHGGQSGRGRTPLFEAHMNYLRPAGYNSLAGLFVESGAGMTVPFGDCDMGPFPIPQQEGQTRFVLEITETGDRLCGYWKFDGSGCPAIDPMRFPQFWEAILARALDEPDVSIGDLRLECRDFELREEWHF